MADRRYWLFKSEPTAYSFADLRQEADQTAEWDGVRNFQARNFLRDEIKVGDGVLFYHSSTNPQVVVGTADVVRVGYPDHTSWDSKSNHHDPKSTPGKPLWYMVDIKADRELERPVTLQEIKQNPRLRNMVLVRPGSRLSIQPVEKSEWDEILAMGSEL